MADDTAALIRYLRLERADVFGFSMGGAIALQTAIPVLCGQGKMVTQ
jgi:pimeloyl-ACP methyl ester carboxylesterase